VADVIAIRTDERIDAVAAKVAEALGISLRPTGDATPPPTVVGP
jgi:hypothetical protein